MYYRYEVTLNNNQQVGILNAPFDSSQLTEDELNQYYELFNRLPCPECKEPVTFFFTRKGYERLYELCEIAFKAVPKHYQPQLNEITVKRLKKGIDILFRDSYQIALRTCDLQHLALVKSFPRMMN